MKHWKYGGSSAARTLNCPGWKLESEGVPRSNSSFAQEGTALHECFEELLNAAAPEPLDYIDSLHAGVRITKQLVTEKLGPAYSAWLQFCKDYKIVEYETEVSAEMNDLVGGSADVVAASEDTIYICDLKTGSGIQVGARDNKQGLFYGMVCRQDPEVLDMFEGKKKLGIVIVQPNDRGEDEVRIWETGIGKLDAFEQEFMAAVKVAEGDAPPLHAGDHCQFCPAAPLCPMKTGDALRALQLDPEDAEILAESMNLARDLKPWIKHVEAAAHDQLEAGVLIEGWKLVEKRAFAKWTDEDEVLELFRRRMGGKAHMVTEKLLTPAQMKKAAKARGSALDFDEFITKTSSGTTVAEADDKRPAVLSSQVLAAALDGLK